MSDQKWYDLRSAKALLDYVFENYRLTATDRKVYRALQSLESQQDGLCIDIVATHRTIHRCAKVSLNTVSVSLKRLEGQGLIVYTPGSKVYADRLASRIRRLSIAELKEAQRRERPAFRLAEILNNRRIQYGDEIVQPAYNVRTTNRLYASEPNVQGKKDVRATWLAAGCKEGQVLIELDFAAAEPSIIAHRLGYEKDGYQIIAEAEGIDRNAVKPLFNKVVYARSTAVAAAKAVGWTSKGSITFFQAVDVLRKQLRRPNGKPARSVVTETGTTIEAGTGKKVFAGTLLSHYAQGTIADFINNAALKIIELEASKGWRLIAPCHDSVYVIAKPENAEELAEIVLGETKFFGVSMSLKIKIQQKEKINNLNTNPREYQKTGTSALKAESA